MTDDISIFFNFQPTVNRLFNNFTKLYTDTGLSVLLEISRCAKLVPPSQKKYLKKKSQPYQG